MGARHPHVWPFSVVFNVSASDYFCIVVDIGLAILGATKTQYDDFERDVRNRVRMGARDNLPLEAGCEASGVFGSAKDLSLGTRAPALWAGGPL